MRILRSYPAILTLQSCQRFSQHSVKGNRKFCDDSQANAGYAKPADGFSQEIPSISSRLATWNTAVTTHFTKYFKKYFIMHHEIYSKLTITLSIYLTFFKCFYCWLWIGKCLLGCLYVQRNDACINSKGDQIKNITTNFGQYFVKYILFHLICWCQDFCKWTVFTDFRSIRLNICGNCSFMENFVTKKLDEKYVFYRVSKGDLLLNKGIPFCKNQFPDIDLHLIFPFFKFISSPY